MAFIVNNPFSPCAFFEYKGVNVLWTYSNGNLVLRDQDSDFAIGRIQFENVFGMCRGILYRAVNGNNIELGSFYFTDSYKHSVIIMGEKRSVGDPLEVLVDHFLSS